MSRVLGISVIGCLALASLVQSSCTVGAPPGFSSGTHWTFPLVDPLADGLLVVPVTIKGKGPYLFAIDPEARDTIIDERIAIEAELLTDHGYNLRIRSEDDNVIRPRFRAELRDIRIGNLAIEVRQAVMVPHETFAPTGLAIRGVLGRNVIEDSLVFGFDRNRGVAWMQEASTFKPAPGATRIDYEIDKAGDNNSPHSVVKAQINGRPSNVELMLGGVISRLRPEVLAALGVNGVAREVIEYDTTGTRRKVPVMATPVTVALGAATNDHVAVGAYINRVDTASDADFFAGTLALDFFAPFRVMVDWANHSYFLEPLGDVAADAQVRLGRWGDFAACKQAGCVTVALAAPQAAPPPSTDAGFTPPSASAPATTYILHVAREPGAQMPIEVRLRAAGQSGVPDLVVDLPAGAQEALAQIRGDLAGVQYQVVDANPFPAACETQGAGCIRH